MIRDGLVDEIRRVWDMGFGEQLPVFRTIGYAQIVDLLHGRSTLEEAVADMATATRRLAKRQLTWLRAELEVQWYTPAQEQDIDRWCGNSLKGKECLTEQTAETSGHSTPDVSPCCIEGAIVQTTYLDFEHPAGGVGQTGVRPQPVETRSAQQQAELTALEAQLRQREAEVFSALSPWQRVQLSRHPDRPYTLDYIEALCSEFVELHGDRVFGDDPAIVGGLARFKVRQWWWSAISAGRR